MGMDGPTFQPGQLNASSRAGDTCNESHGVRLSRGRGVPTPGLRVVSYGTWANRLTFFFFLSFSFSFSFLLPPSSVLWEIWAPSSPPTANVKSRPMGGGKVHPTQLNGQRPNGSPRPGTRSSLYLSQFTNTPPPPTLGSQWRSLSVACEDLCDLREELWLV